MGGGFIHHFAEPNRKHCGSDLKVLVETFAAGTRRWIAGRDRAVVL